MMDAQTRQRLLDLNRRFYATVAEPFDQTRQRWTPGLLRLLEWMPSGAPERPVKVVDVGCGNGRLAWLLDTVAASCEYVGLDGSAELLALARQQARRLAHVHARFAAVDLAQAGWSAALGEPRPTFDVVFCLATLQHLPGYGLRCQVMRELRELIAPGSQLIVSAWQFLSSPRFLERQVDWAEIGLRADDSEAGDALLPWRQGATAIRYVHQIDPGELRRLAANVGLTIVETFRADGKEGDLNLYAILQHTESDEGHERSG